MKEDRLQDFITSKGSYFTFMFFSRKIEVIDLNFNW